MAAPPPVATLSTEQLPHLETLARAAELGSFTAAAHALGLTQAAISQRIRALESVLGVPLFRREGGHAFLTAAGEKLHAYAQRILLLHQEARQEITGKKAPITGDLSLAASSVPGEHLLPALLADFGRRYPHIRVKASVADSRAVMEQVEQGRVNLGLVGGKKESPHLTFRRFASDCLVLVVPAGHALTRRKRISLAQFLRERLIVREAGSGSRWCLERALAQVGKSAKDLTIALELGSNEAIKEAVQRRVGVAMLSDHAVEKEVKTKQLHSLRVNGLHLERDMFLVWDRRRALPIPARLFLDFAAPDSAADQRS